MFFKPSFTGHDPRAGVQFGVALHATEMGASAGATHWLPSCLKVKILLLGVLKWYVGGKMLDGERREYVYELVRHQRGS